MEDDKLTRKVRAIVECMRSEVMCGFGADLVFEDTQLLLQASDALAPRTEWEECTFARGDGARGRRRQDYVSQYCKFTELV